MTNAFLENGASRKVVKYEQSLDKSSIFFMVEYLAEYAHRWRDIGSALKFQQKDLDAFDAKNGKKLMHLQTLLEQWLEGKYPHATPPTLTSILKALANDTIRLVEVAGKMRKSLPQIMLDMSDQIIPVITLDHSHYVEVEEDTLSCLRQSELILKFNCNLTSPGKKWRDTTP